MATELAAAGVDAFHVSGGVIDRLVTGMVNGADDGDAVNVGAAAAVNTTPSGGAARELAADSVVLAGTLEPDTALFDDVVAAMAGVDVYAAGDCSGVGLFRKATEDGARAACAI